MTYCPWQLMVSLSRQAFTHFCRNSFRKIHHIMFKQMGGSKASWTMFKKTAFFYRVVSLRKESQKNIRTEESNKKFTFVQVPQLLLIVWRHFKGPFWRQTQLGSVLNWSSQKLNTIPNFAANTPPQWNAVDIMSQIFEEGQTNWINLSDFSKHLQFWMGSLQQQLGQ